jgi:hypothetical protein
LSLRLAIGIDSRKITLRPIIASRQRYRH